MNGPVTVREVMNREYVGASEGDPVRATAELLVTEAEERALVLRGNDPVGVVTRADLLAHLIDDEGTGTQTVGTVMTESLPTIAPEARLPEARDTMAAQSAQWLLVVEDGDPVGTVTAYDVLSSSLLEGETRGVVEEREQLATAGQPATTDGATSAAEDSFDDQGICSACGTLTQQLASFNGQLLCADCRDV